MATNTDTIITMALTLLAARVMLILGLGMTFGLFCWSMWEHSWISLAIAGAFAVGVFLPVLLRSDHGKTGT
jgi:uncharacterized membrane protein